MSMFRSSLAAVALAYVSFAQQAPPSIPFVISPDPQPDGKVTFNVYVPNAKQVLVSLEGTKAPFVAQKDGRGVWSATTGVLAPDIYGYSFVIDGVTFADPSNTNYKSNFLFAGNVVQVPGPVQPWDDTDIPHGLIHHHHYHSNVVNDDRDFYV